MSTVYSSMLSAINHAITAATMWGFAIAIPASGSFERCFIAMFRRSRTISIGIPVVSSREVAEIGDLIHRCVPCRVLQLHPGVYRRHHVGIEHRNCRPLPMWPYSASDNVNRARNSEPGKMAVTYVCSSSTTGGDLRRAQDESLCVYGRTWQMAGSALK